MSTPQTNKAIIIGNSTDASSSSFSLQPKTTTQTVADNKTKKIISDEKYNYGAPSWNSMDGPSTIADTEKAARKGTANIWQERVPAPSDGTPGADYVYVRNGSDSEVTFSEDFKLLGKEVGVAVKSNKTPTDKTNGPAWTRNTAWNSIATYR